MYILTQDCTLYPTWGGCPTHLIVLRTKTAFSVNMNIIHSVISCIEFTFLIDMGIDYFFKWDYTLSY